MFKLQTKNGADHFLEACSREERDNWAGDITAVAEKLRTAGGGEVTNGEEPAGSQLHNINLRLTEQKFAHRLKPSGVFTVSQAFVFLCF